MKRPVPRPGALQIRRIERHPQAELADAEWPATIPAIAQLLHEGLDLTAVTVLVGENGSGKSTLVEAIAQAYGLSGEGGSVNAGRTRTRAALSALPGRAHALPAAHPLSPVTELSRGWR
jgi:predicted ATPase